MPNGITNIFIMPGTDTTGWPEVMFDLFGALGAQLDTMVQTGNMINPNIEISPEIAAGFLSQAQTELDPYYSQLINIAQQDFARQGEYYEFQADLARQRAGAARGAAMAGAGIRLRTAKEIAELQREAAMGNAEARKELEDEINKRQDAWAKADLPPRMAEMGLAFSGVRTQEAGKIQQLYEEAQKVTQTQFDITERSTTANYQSTIKGAQGAYAATAASAGGAYSAATMGLQEQLGFQMAGLGASAETRFGTETVGAWGLPLYNIEGGVTGTLEQERTVAEQSRASEIESAYRAARSLEFYQQT